MHRFTRMLAVLGLVAAAGALGSLPAAAGDGPASLPGTEPGATTRLPGEPTPTAGNLEVTIGLPGAGATATAGDTGGSATISGSGAAGLPGLGAPAAGSAATDGAGAGLPGSGGATALPGTSGTGGSILPGASTAGGSGLPGVERPTAPARSVAPTGAASTESDKPLLPEVPWRLLLPAMALGFAGLIFAAIRSPRVATPVS